jgi:hypothetical protein
MLSPAKWVLVKRETKDVPDLPAQVTGEGDAVNTLVTDLLREDAANSANDRHLRLRVEALVQAGLDFLEYGCVLRRGSARRSSWLTPRPWPR